MSYFRIPVSRLGTILLSTIFATLLFFLSFQITYAITPGDSANFITTWDTTNPGTSADNQITIPGSGGGYNYEIYWENMASSTINGTTTVTSNTYTLTFPEAGKYRVEISGAFPRINFNNTGDKEKILTVEQWGNIVWTSMDSAFFGTTNLRVPATDAPNLSGVTSMRRMFRDAPAFNEPINHWDVSQIISMEGLFQGAISFNQPLNNWNVANVTFMQQLFTRTLFNQDINDWEVQNVQNMAYIFSVSPFNQPLDKWNTSNVTLMNHMFLNTPFNQDISSWDVSKVANMRNMFAETPFNQPITEWETTSVTDMSLMFRNNSSFNQDLSNLDITHITNLEEILLNVSLSTSNLDSTLSSWTSQAVTNDIHDISLHIGLKTYSSVGAEALDTLRSLGWQITEQYSATYRGGPHATLLGTSYQAPLDSGGSTTAIEIRPDKHCTFIDWSDGNTSNPRIDIMTDDNINVTANVECEGGSQITSGATGARVQAFREQNNFTTTDTLDDTISQIGNLLSKPLDPNMDQDTLRKFIEALTQLLALLTQMLVAKIG